MKSWNKNRHKRFDLFSAITIMTALLVIFFIGSAISAVIVSGIPCFAETIRSPEVLFAFRLSFTTASISTIIVMALALPTAYALTRTDMPFKRLSGLMIELTLSLPYILLGLSLLIIFSSPAGIVMAHILVNLPYAIRLIRTAFETSDQRLEFIAQTLGASPWKCFLTILLPLCRGSLISAFILTWSRALGEFGATLMLVGVTRFKTETLPGSIYLSISTGNNPTAMATAMLMLLISGCTLFLAQFMGKSWYQHERQVGGQINYTKCRNLNGRER